MELCSILTLLGSGNQNLHETYQCRMHSRKLLLMGRELVRLSGYLKRNLHFLFNRFEYTIRYSEGNIFS
jgi:hypothetical protein